MECMESLEPILSRTRLVNTKRLSLTETTGLANAPRFIPWSQSSRLHDSLNKPKPNTAETSLIVSIVEVLVYAIYRNTSRLRLTESVRDHVDLKSAPKGRIFLYLVTGFCRLDFLVEIRERFIYILS